MRIGELARATGETVKTLRYGHDADVREVERARAEPAPPCDDGCAYLDPRLSDARPQTAGASARASAPVTPVRNAK